jgi:hypothetical protein
MSQSLANDPHLENFYKTIYCSFSIPEIKSLQVNTLPSTRSLPNLSLNQNAAPETIKKFDMNVAKYDENKENVPYKLIKKESSPPPLTMVEEHENKLIIDEGGEEDKYNKLQLKLKLMAQQYAINKSKSPKPSQMLEEATAVVDMSKSYNEKKTYSGLDKTELISDTEIKNSTTSSQMLEATGAVSSKSDNEKEVSSMNSGLDETEIISEDDDENTPLSCLAKNRSSKIEQLQKLVQEEIEEIEAKPSKRHKSSGTSQSTLNSSIKKKKKKKKHSSTEKPEKTSKSKDTVKTGDSDKKLKSKKSSTSLSPSSSATPLTNTNSDSAVSDDVRAFLKKSLLNELSDRLNSKNDKMGTVFVAQLEQLVAKIEHELYECYKSNQKKYKGQYMQIILNVRDKTNDKFYSNILSGNITPANVVQMKSEDMASDQRYAERQTMRQNELDKCLKFSDEVAKEKTNMIVYGKYGVPKEIAHSLEVTEPENDIEMKQQSKEPVATKCIIPNFLTFEQITSALSSNKLIGDETSLKQDQVTSEVIPLYTPIQLPSVQIPQIPQIKPQTPESWLGHIESQNTKIPVKGTPMFPAFPKSAEAMYANFSKTFLNQDLSTLKPMPADTILNQDKDIFAYLESVSKTRELIFIKFESTNSNDDTAKLYSHVYSQFKDKAKITKSYVTIQTSNEDEDFYLFACPKRKDESKRSEVDHFFITNFCIEFVRDRDLILGVVIGKSPKFGVHNSRLGKALSKRKSEDSNKENKVKKARIGIAEKLESANKIWNELPVQRSPPRDPRLLKQQEFVMVLSTNPGSALTLTTSLVLQDVDQNAAKVKRVSFESKSENLNNNNNNDKSFSKN